MDNNTFHTLNRETDKLFEIKVVEFEKYINLRFHSESLGKVRKRWILVTSSTMPLFFLDAKIRAYWLQVCNKLQGQVYAPQQSRLPLSHIGNESE